MINPNFKKLASLLINHSCSLKKDEKILIEGFDVPQEMVIALIRAARKVGGLPFVTWKNNLILKELISETTKQHMGLMGSVEKQRMEHLEAYIGLRGSFNISEMSDIDSEKMAIYQEIGSNRVVKMLEKANEKNTDGPVIGTEQWALLPTTLRYAISNSILGVEEEAKENFRD